MKFPRIVYVHVEKEGDGTEFLLVEKDKEGLSGRVATYQLVEEYEARQVTEFRRRGTKGWVK